MHEAQRPAIKYNSNVTDECRLKREAQKIAIAGYVIAIGDPTKHVRRLNRTPKKMRVLLGPGTIIDDTRQGRHVNTKELIHSNDDPDAIDI